MPRKDFRKKYERNLLVFKYMQGLVQNNEKYSV